MSFYKEGPVTDPAPVIAKIKEISAAATELSVFEADLLKEVAHAAVRFQATFRISKKQEKVLEELWLKHCLPLQINSKVKKG